MSASDHKRTHALQHPRGLDTVPDATSLALTLNTTLSGPAGLRSTQVVATSIFTLPVGGLPLALMWVR
jgi:hypothetical protein